MDAERVFYNKKSTGLEPGNLAAHTNFRLLLLPSGPDKIHSMTPHGTQPSSPTDLNIIAHFRHVDKPRSCFLHQRARKRNQTPASARILRVVCPPASPAAPGGRGAAAPRASGGGGNVKMRR